ncbi:MAG: class I SAM-dependent methyltransferase [Bacteroidota bacterium]
MEKQKEWFASWFDTPYYHILYKHRDYKEAERFINNLVNDLRLTGDEQCLDLACGKGRHSIFLNKLGLDVTGVDLSHNSIEAAKEFENERLRFDVHDMRKPYQTNAFDVVFNLFTSFGYFDRQEDNLAVVQSIVEMLKDGGVAVIDFMNVEKSIANLVPSETKTIDGIEFSIRRTFDGDYIKKDIAFEDNGQSFQFQERVQALRPADFEALFEKAGLEVKEVYGDFSLRPFDPATSDRLIYICEK